VRHALVVFIPVRQDNVQILSTIARLSGGAYDVLPEITMDWRRYTGAYRRLDDPKGVKQEEAIARDYLSPMLLCGKPDSIGVRRWLLKALSNDQTAFTGFTSLVDVVDSGFGFDGSINLVPGASFVEPFVLEQVDATTQDRLLAIQEELKQKDVTQLAGINALLAEAVSITPQIRERAKGKSPLFFYGVPDKPFQISSSLYERMVAVTNLVYGAIEEETRMWSDRFGVSNQARATFTGSIDFMLVDDTIYVIDIGTPAVGYVADIIATSNVLGRTPDIGLDTITASLGGCVSIPQSRYARELGFFKQERDVLIAGLRDRGIVVDEEESEGIEASVNGEQYPNSLFDYLSRNQPLRNAILGRLRNDLAALGARVPESITTMPSQDFALAQFYDRTSYGTDYGLIVKKKPLFTEYYEGNGSYKPLVVPLWSREARADRNRSTLFEEFVPSLVDVEILGESKGKRSCEIRMYYVGGRND
jgi:hypothetical protein